jgi:hypothetical protein
MEDMDRAALMLDRLGLSTEGLGPVEEWAPIPRAEHQQRHDTFWRAVCDILPDCDTDEEEWMTETASAQLEGNN